MQFGEKLRRLRQERNLTQPDLAEQLGIEQSWLSKLENDKSLPSSDLLDRVCEVFSISLEQLLAELDSRYIRNQLGSLPEVRGLLQEKRYTLVHNARRWLLTATACVAVGLTLFLCGNGQWVFSEVQFRYESQGLVFKNEPEGLFYNSKDYLMPIAMAAIEAEAIKSGDLKQYYESKLTRLDEVYLLKIRAKLQQRENVNTQVSYKHLGDYYRVEVTAPEDSTDIYGNPVVAGEPAYRIYTIDETLPNPRWQNSLFKILGVLLATAGFLLYFVELRMAKATKGI